MKIWSKGKEAHQLVDQFTVGNDRVLDVKIAKYDVEASIAHATMLGEVGLISEEEANLIVNELKNLGVEVSTEGFEIPVIFEDVHSFLEARLIEVLGDVGKKVHTGRSRNDQVLVAMHLYLKNECVEIEQLMKALFDQLLTLCEAHKEALMPGYTHFQVAMPSSFGLWFGAYAESLIDDKIILGAARQIADQNPLGSAAGYGSSFPLSRTRTTELLNFTSLKYNAVAAQMSRGKLEKSMAFGLSSVASTLSRMAMDVTLYMSQNFGFMTFPDELTTGSSIMPHKKNPDVFELIRGKCNKIMALPTELTLITNNLPSGYHREYQLLKESLFDAISEMKSCLEMTRFMFDNVIIKKGVLNDDKYDLLFSVENVNALVNEGMTFRDAYIKVGQDVAGGKFVPSRDLHHTHEGSIGNLCTKEIRTKWEAY